MSVICLRLSIYIKQFDVRWKVSGEPALCLEFLISFAIGWACCYKHPFGLEYDDRFPLGFHHSITFNQFFIHLTIKNRKKCLIEKRRLERQHEKKNFKIPNWQRFKKEEKKLFFKTHTQLEWNNEKKCFEWKIHQLIGRAPIPKMLLVIVQFKWSFINHPRLNNWTEKWFYLIEKII